MVIRGTRAQLLSQGKVGLQRAQFARERQVAELVDKAPVLETQGDCVSCSVQGKLADCQPSARVLS